jgi:hypothetical protein
MQPQELRAENFAHYPPQARALAVANISVLQRIPLALLPVMLHEVINYDWRFPMEQQLLVRQFQYLKTLQPAYFATLMAPFAAIRLPKNIGHIDWVNQPQHFTEQLSALLWSMQEMDDYRTAALRYQEQLQQALIEKPPAMPRFTIVTVGHDVPQTNLPLFRPLRPHGVLFTAVQSDNGLETLLEFVNDRAQKHPEKYAHWYIDGGKPAPACGPQQGVTLTSYYKLAPAALKELNLTQRFVERTSKTNAVGPEAVQSFMAALSPADLGLHEGLDNVSLRYFEVDVLTKGAGTQVFSTTFVQWAAREAMRRSQPLTMLARFAPRQRMAPMNELLKRNPLTQETDTEGSLVDSDMGAYYTWINQKRLTGAEQARFLAWYEGHNIAIAIAPGMPQGTTSDAPTSLGKILEWMG